MKNKGLWLLFMPLALWLVAFLLLPYLRVFVVSFYETDDFGMFKPGLSMDAYQRFFTHKLCLITFCFIIN